MALVEAAPDLPPFWRARTELLYGQWLRRQRRRQDARGHLRAAVDLFRQLLAQPWEDRAAAELRAAGKLPAPAARKATHRESSASESSSARIRVTDSSSFGRSRVTVFHTTSKSISK